MKRNPNAPKFKGVRACGCVTWLYSAEFDTQRQQEIAIARAIQDGLEIVQLKTEEDMNKAREEWGDCPHSRHYLGTRDEARTEARRILEEAA